MACHAAELWVTVRGGGGGEETGKKEQDWRGPSLVAGLCRAKELQRHKHRGDLGNSTRTGRCGNACCSCEGVEPCDFTVCNLYSSSPDETHVSIKFLQSGRWSVRLENKKLLLLSADSTVYGPQST